MDEPQNFEESIETPKSVLSLDLPDEKLVKEIDANIDRARTVWKEKTTELGEKNFRYYLGKHNLKGDKKIIENIIFRNVETIVPILTSSTPEPRVFHPNKKFTDKLRKVLIDGLLKNIPGAILNTDLNNSSPSHAHFTFPGAEGESILISLDLEGVAVSTGSACAAGSLEPSHVLLAMGIPAEIAHSSIRFTLGKYNAGAEIKKVIKILPPIIARLRKMNPNYK